MLRSDSCFPPDSWKRITWRAQLPWSLVVCVCGGCVLTQKKTHFAQSWLFATPWTVACQAPLSTGFPRQEYWGGLPFSSPGELPDPGTEPESPALQVDLYRLSYQVSPEFGRVRLASDSSETDLAHYLGKRLWLKRRAPGCQGRERPQEGSLSRESCMCASRREKWGLQRVRPWVIFKRTLPKSMSFHRQIIRFGGLGASS